MTGAYSGSVLTFPVLAKERKMVSYNNALAVAAEKMGMKLNPVLCNVITAPTLQ